jgi:hypothetical protein
MIADPKVKLEDKPSPYTLKGHRSLLTRACDVKDPDGDRMGGLDADIPEEGFVHIQDSFGARTGAADNCIKALRAAYRWGKKRSGFPKVSEIVSVEKIHTNRGGATPWTASDVENFLAVHQSGSMARIWFWLAASTLGRIGDAPYLGADNIEDCDGLTLLAWQPRKKGSKPVAAPVLPMLLQELETQNRRNSTTFLVTEYGKPFASSNSLDNRVRKWLIEAGLCYEAKNSNNETTLRASRSQHGIRKGLAHFLARSGATQYELMSIMSHSEAKTSEVYTKDVERRDLAIRAAGRLEEIMTSMSF